MASHAWRFARIGGFDQPLVSTGADLKALGELDQKLWVALACPVTGLALDERTLALMDGDGDKRIRAPELIAAAEWATSRVKDPEVLVQGGEALALDSIDDGTDEGRLLLKTASELLRNGAKKDAKAITVADMKAALEAFHKQAFNGDAILPAASAEDEPVRKAIEDVLACTTPETDGSGQPGVTKKTVEAFFADVRAHAEWLAKADGDEAISPLGKETDAAFAALSAVRAKVDDYFARARVAAYDARALAVLNGDEKEYAGFAGRTLTASASELEHLPLAQVQVGKPLTLEQGLHPAWAARMAELGAKVVAPLLGARTTLTEEAWGELKQKLAAHDAWLGAKAGASVEKLGAERVRQLAGSDLEEKILALVAEDASKEPLAKALEGVERLVHYHRDLITLVNNFVCFRDFYDLRRESIFQAGTLYIDTRACDLCLRVDDPARHATMGPLANTYLLYCDCKNAKGEKMSICAAVTAGDVDNLMVGRNGVFYDRKGQDWDATITKIVDQPISVRQAFWAPYKKVIRLVEQQIAKRAEAAQAESDARLTTGVEETSATVAAGGPATPAEPAAPKKLDIGVVAAIGVAVGGVTAALGAFLQAFFGLGWLMPLGMIGLMAAVSGPSMAIAWLKLRKRTLGPLLDASGWAINAQARVNVPLGTLLTETPRLPEGASRDLVDPFAEKKRPWALYVVLLVLLVAAGAWLIGKLDGWLPSQARSTSVLGEHAPASWRSDAGPPPAPR